MPSAFLLFGELKADTQSFQNSLRDSEARLNQTEKAIGETEKKAKSIGQTSATTARAFEQLNEKLSDARQRLNVTAEAFSKGAANATQMRSALLASENASQRLNSRLADTSARLTDAANKQSAHTKTLFSGVAAGNLMANAVSNLAGEVKQFVVDGVKMNASLDKLVRFTSTLDKNFQNPIALKRFSDSIKQLSTEIPHSAEAIAAASFSIKSAFSNLNETQTIDYLKQFGLAATASNTDIASHVENVVALAKQYKITADQLPRLNALIASSFGQALAKDSSVAQGFNDILNAAIATKQPLETVIATMSTLQGASNNAAQNTTLLGNVLAKLTDGKYQEGFKAIGISIFDASGNFRDLKDIVADMAKQMAGLNDEQINNKFAFLKDKEAREGFLTLARNHAALQQQLKDGSGMDAFRQKTEVMMGAVESRWAQFYNNIANDQSGAGSAISDFFLSAFDSTTVVGGVLIFFNNVGGAVLQGITSLLGSFDGYTSSFTEAFASLFLSDEYLSMVKQQNQKNTDLIGSLYSGIGKEVEKNSRFVLEKQKKYWQDFAESTADPTAKAQALKNVDDLTKSIQRSITGASVGQYEAWKKLGDSVLQGLGSADGEAKKRAFDLGKSVVDEINKALANPNLDPSLAQEFKKLLDELKKSLDASAPTIQQSSYRLGTNVWQGMVNGINSGRGAVSTAAANLAGAATVGAENKLQIASPSKVFFKIGTDVVQGFVDGINSLRSSAASAMEGILQIPSSLKGFGKTDVEGIKLLGSLAGELARVNVETKHQGVLLDLTAGAYAKLNPQLREAIKNTAAQIDLQKNFIDGTGKLNSILDSLTEATSPAKTELEKLNIALADKNVILALNQKTEAIRQQTIALARLKAIALDDAANPFAGMTSENGRDGTDTGGIEFKIPEVQAQIQNLKPPPELPQLWDNFFNGLSIRLGELSARLPTIRENLYETFADLPLAVGDIFGNAVKQWDGTLQGFFKSVGRGFADLLKEIAAQIIRLMIIKAVTKIMDSFAGGFGGGGGASGGFGGGGDFGGGGAGGSFASGGYTGAGRASEIAGAVHKGEFVFPADVVRRIGVPQLEGMMNMSHGFAQGGYTGGYMPAAVNNSSSNSVVNHVTMNIQTPNAESFRKSQGQLMREAQQKLDAQRAKKGW